MTCGLVEDGCGTCYKMLLTARLVSVLGMSTKKNIRAWSCQADLEGARHRVEAWLKSNARLA